MKRQLIKPDFCNNIINISATLAEFLNCPNDKPILPALKNELEKGYNNVVFLILDGMGMNPVNINLEKDAFLRKNIRQILTSVFPSTTANATMSYLTNKYPMEHGWFGWSLYFEDLHRAVDIFPGRDSFTEELIDKSFIKNALPVEPYYKRAKSDYTTSVVVPEYWDNDYENRYVWNTVSEMFDHIGTICRKAGKQFIYAYCSEPDFVMHRFGVSSAEARSVIGELNGGVEALYAELADTLLIVSADHGQIDVGGYVELYKDEELTAMLEWPQFLEVRAVAFKVKKDCREKFAEVFHRKYGADFTLFEVEKLIKENYFGGNFRGEHAKLLGDYIAIGTTDKIMQLTPFNHPFKGHHTSLTEEMEVPLIFIGKK